MDNNEINELNYNNERKEEQLTQEPEAGGIEVQNAAADREPEALMEESGKEKKKKEKREKKERKQHGFFFRAVRATVCAVLVGAVAGASAYGAMYAGYINFPVQQEESTELSPQLLEAVNQAVQGAVDSAAVAAGMEDGIKNLADTLATSGSIQTMAVDVSDLVKKAVTSVVAINGTQTITNNYGYFFGYSQSYEAQCSGSGIIIGANDEELLVVTNAHVVNDVNDIMVTFCDGTSVEGTIKGMRTESDLAVVSISLEDISEDTRKAISIAKLGSSSDIEVGQAAIAIGNAKGYGISVTTGIVSAVGRSLTVDGVEYEDLIQTDAAINPGNSGGALFNAQGEVIGINSVKMSDTSIEGMGYAISIESVKDIIDDLSTRTALNDEERGYLGVSGNTVTSEISRTYGWPEGVLVRSVSEGSAADKAGIEVNDVITSFDGRTIDSWETLINTVQYYEVGATVEVGYYHLSRGSFEERTVTVTLTEKPVTGK